MKRPPSGPGPPTRLRPMTKGLISTKTEAIVAIDIDPRRRHDVPLWDGLHPREEIVGAW